MTESKTRAAVYIRTAAHNDAAAEEQRRECMQYIERMGYQFAGEYVDLGASGIRNIRKAFDAITVDAHIGEIDKIVVHSFSRISRSMRDAVSFCSDLKESCGVIIESAEEE